MATIGASHSWTGRVVWTGQLQKKKQNLQFIKKSRSFAKNEIIKNFIREMLQEAFEINNKNWVIIIFSKAIVF